MKSQIIWSIALLVQFYKLSKLLGSIKTLRKLLKKISELKLLSIPELKNKILEGGYNIGDLILCKGVASTDLDLKSFINKSLKVVYSELVVEKVFQIGQTRNIVRKQLGRLMGGFMRLKGGGQEIKVFQTVGTQFLPTKYLKKTFSYDQKIFNLGWFLSLLLKSPTRVVSNIYTEQLIPQDTQITLLCRISSPNVSELSHPLTIANSREQILSFYSEQLDNNKFLFYSLIVCIALSTFFFYKLCLKPLYQSLVSKKENGNLNRIQKIYVKSYNCINCQKNLSSVIHSPCGHFVVCGECWEANGGDVGQCQECQSKTTENIVVFPC